MRKEQQGGAGQRMGERSRGRSRSGTPRAKRACVFLRAFFFPFSFSVAPPFTEKPSRDRRIHKMHKGVQREKYEKKGRE